MFYKFCRSTGSRWRKSAYRSWRRWGGLDEFFHGRLPAAHPLEYNLHLLHHLLVAALLEEAVGSIHVGLKGFSLAFRMSRLKSVHTAESEKLIQTAIENLQGSRTILVVAHRLSTVTKANRIHVIEAGRIIESGTLQELLVLNGRFKLLYDKQFGNN